jgi:hypothetical protein
VRRRICVIGAALSVGSLAIGAVAASAAPTSTSKAITKVTCKTATGISVAQGDSSVTPPVAQGTEYGPVRCGKGLGDGVLSVAFKVPDSGNTLGVFKAFLTAGTLHGKYTLVPQEGTFSATSFNETDYLGTMTITGGTGAYQGAKGTGKMVCKTLDGIHTTCTNRLKLTRL